MTNHFSEEQLAEILARDPAYKVVSSNSLPVPVKGLESHPVKPHKYHAVRTEYNGKSYPSRKEAQHAQDNDLKIKAGYLTFFLEQVPIRLIPSSTIYRVDFVEFNLVANTHLYEVAFVETKGYKTPVGELKRKQAEAILGIKIKVV